MGQVTCTRSHTRTIGRKRARYCEDVTTFISVVETGHIEIRQVAIVRLPHPRFSKGKFN